MSPASAHYRTQTQIKGLKTKANAVFPGIKTLTEIGKEKKAIMPKKAKKFTGVTGSGL